MSKRRLSWVAAAIIAQAVRSQVAMACPAPATYVTSVDGNGVSVLTRNECLDASSPVLLRQDISTGDVVRVRATCKAGWFVDDCVAPGQYRYGLEQPMLPPDSSCTCGPYDYFGVASVSQPLATGCVSTDQSDPNSVPWASEQTICAPTTCTSPAPGAPCDPASDGGDTAAEPASGGCNVSGGLGGDSLMALMALGWLLRSKRNVER